ncbi:MAG: hypothetical protein DDT36_00319 [Firmicutes bacterium]|nr:hypothetical protein [Bacillota bacterium]
MPRSARQESATGYYHVVLRGINREHIFRADVGKLLFLDLVSEQQTEGRLQLVCWCLMSNHAHLIIRADVGAMSMAIKLISQKYSAHHNRRQKRVGPAFGGRFSSESIEDDRYLLGALRYIHMNPVKAKLVDDPLAYKWSSFGEYLGKASFIDPAQKAFVLSLVSGEARDFVALHHQKDETGYLETREEVLANKERVAVALIEGFCQEKGVAKAREVYARPELFAEICHMLVVEGKLPLRQAAELLGTTHNKVYLALQDDR